MNDIPDGQGEQEVELGEVSFAEALTFAIRLHQANCFEQADEVYRKLLELAPENPDLLHFFGVLRHQSGHSDEGIGLVKRALNLVPDYADAENNLGNMYLQTGYPDLAEPCFRRVLEKQPDNASCHANLGVALKELGRFTEAIENLLKAVDREPEEAHHYRNLGNVYRALRDYRTAVDMYTKSLALEPMDGETFRKLSRTFYIMGEMGCCIEVLRQWLEIDPENSIARHNYAALTKTELPSRASDDYVRQTFDGFAASFDGVLRRLEYKAPFLVQQALQRLNPDPNHWRLLDAGCGTGLSGALLRPLVKTLDGVDLSPKMLERAQAREIYDQLVEAELTAYFNQSAAIYDAISCVDTFCYFGDLNDAVIAAHDALKPGGWFVFTLEKLEEAASTDVFRLNEHGRYSHAESYVRNALCDAGFQIHQIESETLRRERQAHVAGLVVTAQKCAPLE